jgi:glycosyltransferase involved in cell wall biosynthesis
VNERAPGITVLMPVHNGEAFLGEAAESILRQTCHDFELLIVDDGSTDATPAILSKIAAEDSRVRVEGGRIRLGFSGALNAGLDLARGEYIARMDADDIALPHRLEVQREYLHMHPEVGLCGGLVETFGLRRGTFYRPPLSWEETLCYALFDNPFAHPTVMLRRDLIEKHRLRFDPGYCPADDYELWSRCLRLFRCVNLNRVLLRYRVHARSLTQAEWSDMDGHAARIAARELTALGMPTGDREVQFHRNMGRGSCFQVLRREELRRAEQWLHALLEANRCTDRYPENIFRRIVAGVWFKVCYHAGAMGTAMLSHYAMSMLRQFRHTSAKEWLALGLMALKGRSV